MFSNHSEFRPPIFLLTGFPGLEKLHFWISLPICSMYLVALTGNCTILFVIRTDQTLHSPMYYFLSMLALSDLGLSLATLPTMLSVLWFSHREIHFDACLVQMFFIHTFSILESGILLSMAFDCWVAIQNSLRYIREGHQDWGGASPPVHLPCPARSLPSEVSAIWEGKCAFLLCVCDLLKVVHSDKRISNSLIAMLSSTGMDFLLLVLSYVWILRTILGVAFSRALSTCTSHLCVVLGFYIPMLGLSMIPRLWKQVSHLTFILIASAYLLVPPMMNPIVPSVKTKQIFRRILKKFQKEGAP